MSPSNPVARFSYGAISQGIRIVILGGDPWFVARDVLAALGLNAGGASQFLKAIPSDEKAMHRVVTPGGAQPMLMVNESGLYRLAMRSFSPAARVFQDWVARDVIPTIRKTGSYTVAAGGLKTFDTPADKGLKTFDTLPDHNPIACAAADLQARIKRARREIEECNSALKALRRVSALQAA
ncbi:BRO-N domain-containing protein [Inquilinus limosus]|uniref:BRO-N domain-containing protein n=1 Tax=Inquilinus limosus TaxID=171674 RepID=UPI000688198F|nr:Bro-N domain-containing protein [Inquilinus limosus]